MDAVLCNESENKEQIIQIGSSIHPRPFAEMNSDSFGLYASCNCMKKEKLKMKGIICLYNSVLYFAPASRRQIGQWKLGLHFDLGFEFCAFDAPFS